MKYSVMVILILSAAVSGYFYATSTQDLDEMLEEMVKYSNKKLPMMIDKDTRLDSIYGDNQTIQYFYTFVNHTADRYDPKTFNRIMYPEIKSEMCSSKVIQPFFEQGVSVEHHYLGKNSGLITVITITPGDCGVGN